MSFLYSYQNVSLQFNFIFQGFFAGIFLKNNNDNMTTIKELLGQGKVVLAILF